MTQRSNQYDYSNLHKDVYYEGSNRVRKAETILAVLECAFDGELPEANILDIGASTGFIDNYLADHVGNVFGVDIDTPAIEFAQQNFKKSNLKFETADIMTLDLPKNSFDIIICNHVYEHVPDDRALMSRIFELLTDSGACYFTAGNRLSVMEPHYRLPFLSIIPRPLAHLYMRLAAKGDYYHEKHRSYWGLKKLVEKFSVDDYTLRLVAQPKTFKTEYMLKHGSAKQKLALLLLSFAYWLCPTYIWILKKAP